MAKPQTKNVNHFKEMQRNILKCLRHGETLTPVERELLMRRGKPFHKPRNKNLKEHNKNINRIQKVWINEMTVDS